MPSEKRPLPTGDNLENSPHVLVPKQARSREALAKIISAAEDLIRRGGIPSFAITEVANVAKIPVGNIYRRFKSRDELLLAIKAEMVRKVSDFVADRILHDSSPNLPEFVQAFADATIQSMTPDEEMYRELLKWNPEAKAFLKSEAAGHLKVYNLYRDAVSPFLPDHPPSKIELLSRISFNIVVLPVIEKTKGDNPSLAKLSWKELGAECARASVSYLRG